MLSLFTALGLCSSLQRIEGYTVFGSLRQGEEGGEGGERKSFPFHIPSYRPFQLFTPGRREREREGGELPRSINKKISLFFQQTHHHCIVFENVTLTVSAFQRQKLQKERERIADAGLKGDVRTDG